MSRGYADVGCHYVGEWWRTPAASPPPSPCPSLPTPIPGYGNAINVRRTIQEYEAGGSGGIHMEDQVFPKKCGFFAGKQVIPMEEHMAKVRAAVDSRSDPDFLIIARCDALAVNGWEDTAAAAGPTARRAPT